VQTLNAFFLTKFPSINSTSLSSKSLSFELLKYFILWSQKMQGENPTSFIFLIIYSDIWL